jgi:uncharacterized protein (DUF58 family)
MPFGFGAAVLLLLLGALLELPILAALGIVVAGAALVHQLWVRNGLSGVEYSRRLERSRAAFGEDIGLTIDIWNRKRLPLAWVRADDAAAEGVAVRGRELVSDELNRRALRNTWTLAPFERVQRQLWVSAERRGLFSIGPTELVVADLFAREAARTELERVDRFLVWPRVVPALGVAHADRWGDLDRAHGGLIDDPARFAGVRTYSPGDPLRRLHNRTSARLGEPVTKRFEPARERQLLIALDIDTGSGWAGSADEELEALYVMCASLVRALAAGGAAFGLTAAGYTRTRERFADVALGRGDGHADRVLDVLARLSHFQSASYEVLLARIPRRFGRGTTVLALTMRDPVPFLGRLRRLRHAGFGVALLCAGPSAGEWVEQARAAGFAARAAALDGDWRSATRLAVSR